MPDSTIRSATAITLFRSELPDSAQSRDGLPIHSSLLQLTPAFAAGLERSGEPVRQHAFVRLILHLQVNIIDRTNFIIVF